MEKFFWLSIVAIVATVIYLALCYIFPMKVGARGATHNKGRH